MSKIKKGHINYQFAAVFAIILIFGLVMLASASQVKGLNYFGDSYYYLKHQLTFGIIPGIALLIIAANVPYHFWQKMALFIFVFALILLMLVFIPQLGLEHGGAKRWIDFGFFSMQPSEIAKLATIIFFSAWLIKKKERVHNFYDTFLPFCVYLAMIVLILALEPNLGTLVVIVISAVTVYFIAGAKLTHLTILGLTAVLIFIILIIIAPYRLNRIITLLNPKTDKLGISYQINQSLIAIGSGSILGQGLGQSKQKYQYLPEATGDSIFAVIAEEMGFVLTTLLIITFLYFIITGLAISARSPDKFGRCLAAGIITWLGFQTMVNIGAMLKLVPLTGLPLPFISYGSSSLIVSMISVGIVLNISRYIKK